MAYQVRDLPALVFTSSFSQALVNLDDANNIGIFCAATTNSLTLTIQVEPTDTGTNWVDLQVTGSSGTATPQTISSGRVWIINNVPFRQLRLRSSGNDLSTCTFTGLAVTKQITV